MKLIPNDKTPFCYIRKLITMSRLVYTAIICVFFIQQASSQCYAPLRAQGIQQEKQGHYEKAIQRYLDALSCPDMPKNNDLSMLIDRALQARVQQLEKAREEAVAARTDLETYARKAMPVLIEDIDNSILFLDYEDALSNCKTAWNLDPGNREVSRRFQEIAYFYTEIGAFDKAEAILIYMDREPEKTGSRREALRAAVKAIDPTYWKDSFETRYYPEMVVVKGGTFCMGRDPAIQGPCDSTDTAVTLDDFGIAETEVTVWQYYLYCQGSGRDSLEWIQAGLGWELQGDFPIVRVSWYDAVQYCNWASRQKSRQPVYTINTTEEDTNNKSVYDDLKWLVIADSNANGLRLPTEAEWEYAARGGIEQDTFKYSGSSELDKVAWHGFNSNGRTHGVAQKKENGLGLYDMSGNVWEWCWDWYGGLESGTFPNPLGPESGSRRVLRGGSWSFINSRIFEVSNRDRYVPSYRYSSIGFRVAQD